MSSLQDLSDRKLLRGLDEVVRGGRVLEAQLLAHLSEVDRRGLYRDEGCPSMFRYCVDVLRFSEAASYKRIVAARAVRVFPDLLVAIERGELHVTAVRLLAPHLNAGNVRELIDWAKHKTADQIVGRFDDGRGAASERTVVRRLPPVSGPGAPSNGRRVDPPEFKRPAPVAPAPVRVTGSSIPATTESNPLPAPPAANGNRVQIRFCANEEVDRQLRELQALMRHQYPDGDLAKILAHAVGVLHRQVRKTKFAECKNPRPAKKASSIQSSRPAARQVPADIRRAVTQRDNGKCSFRSDSGRHCESTEFLEFHHEIPWATQQQHDVDNISLRCRAHNRLAAERDFGRLHMARYSRAETPKPASIPSMSAASRDDCPSKGGGLNESASPGNGGSPNCVARPGNGIGSRLCPRPGNGGRSN